MASDGEIRRYSEHKKQLESLDTPEVKGLFTDWDLASAKRSVLSKLDQNIGLRREELATLKGTSLESDIDAILDAAPQELKDWWLAEEKKTLNLDGVQSGIGAFIGSAIASLDDLQTQTKQHLESVANELTSIQEHLAQKLSGDSDMKRIADLRENAAKRLAKAEGLRQAHEKKRKELLERLSERELLLDRLESLQFEIAGIRTTANEQIEKKLNGFLPEAISVSIDFRAGADKGDLSKRLYEIFGRQGHQRKRVAGVIEANCSPIQFANMVLGEDFKVLIGNESESSDFGGSFTEADAQFVLEKTRIWDHDSSAQSQVLAEVGKRLDAALRLQETRFDDYEAILLNGGPVSEKSPGQRSSAILPLIALAESAPLVIDQPEDNLDKKLIGGVLTQVLAELKEQRQIIVCTHDPNILVGGDAEQVVVLEAKSDRKGTVVNHGSIDNSDIVSTVVDILEGGAEAFETRQKRYGIESRA